MKVFFFLSLLFSNYLTAQPEAEKPEAPPAKVEKKVEPPKEIERPSIDTNLLKDILPDSYLLAPITEKGRNPYKRTQRAFTNVKKPLDRPLTEAEKYQIEEMKFIGYVSKGGVPTLMVRLPTQKVIFLKVGDLIGTEQGKIVEITGKKVTIEESTNTSDTKGGKKLRDISLED